MVVQKRWNSGGKLHLLFQEIHANGLFVFVRKDAFTVTLNHGRFPHSTIANNKNFDSKLDILLLWGRAKYNMLLEWEDSEPFSL